MPKMTLVRDKSGCAPQYAKYVARFDGSKIEFDVTNFIQELLKEALDTQASEIYSSLGYRKIDGQWKFPEGESPEKRAFNEIRRIMGPFCQIG